MENEPSLASPLSCLREDAAGARPLMSWGADAVLAVSAIAWHEAAHCITGRYLGFEIGIATITPSKHFGGTVRGPRCDLDESPADMIADARARCEEALVHMPHRGEPRDDCGAWSVHATSRCIELMAGKEGERLSGFDYEGGRATDMALARAYAATVVYTDGAIGAFLKYAGIEAKAILKKHRTALDAVANGLLEHKTLDGQAIDELISKAEAADEIEAEHKRREAMAKAAKHATVFNRLREVLHYNPETGIFTWLISTSNRVRAGDVAGCVHKASGYLRIKLDGRNYKAHRLAFLFMTGIWAPHQIDHSNLVKTDNRWVNLRMATGSQNSANTCAGANNKSGYKGVSWYKRNHKWLAQIQINGKCIFLGYRDTKDEAAALYAEAAEKYHGEFARIE
jgi:hypothetical protein